MNIGFIPLRKGSKGIPGKNIKKILGRPLYAWVLGEAILSNLDKIFIYTDDYKLIDFINEEYIYSGKVEAIKRSDESATDTSSTEYAMKEFYKKVNVSCTTLTLLQATSPLLTSENINKSISLVKSEGFDSALSVARTKRFLWNEKGESLNYNYNERPRRQEFDGILLENGAVYTTSEDAYNNSYNRLSGNIGINEMPEESMFEIDEPSDFTIVELLLVQRLSNQKTPNKKISTVVLDVDGVFTNGKVLYSKEGEFGKVFNMRDGMGLENLSNDINVIILTSENSELVRKRMEKLNMKNVYLGVKDKYAKLNAIVNKFNISRSEILYLGDDINDLSNIISCGWGVCPNDATTEVKQHADIILNNDGGDLAIREALSFVNKYNQRFLLV